MRELKVKDGKIYWTTTGEISATDLRTEVENLQKRILERNEWIKENKTKIKNLKTYIDAYEQENRDTQDLLDKAETALEELDRQTAQTNGNKPSSEAKTNE